MKTSRTLHIVAAIASLAVADQLRAGTLYWDTSTASGSQVGSNPWDLSTLTWSATTGTSPASNGTVLTAWVDDSDAVFASPTAGGPSTLTIGTGATMRANTITVSSNSQQATITGGTLRLDTTTGQSLINTSNSGSLTIESDLLLAGSNAGYFQNGTAAITINGNISETGGARIVRAVSGTITLGGTNTTTGGTKLNSGTTIVANKAAAIGSGTIDIASGSTQTVFRANFASNGTLANTVNIGLSGTGVASSAAILSSGAGAVNFSKTTAVTFGQTIVGGEQTLGILSLVFGGASTADNTFAGIIGNSGTGVNLTSVSKQDAGKWILSGANTYSGGTTISAGTLKLGHASALGSSTGALTVSGGTLDLGGFTATTGAATITGGTVTGGTLNAQSYAVQSGTISASLGGSGGLTKSTSGVVTLSGSNAYTGATVISAGTVVLSSASGSNIASSSAIDFTTSGSGVLDVRNVSGGFSVVSGQTIKGTGTVLGNTTIAGNLNPGNSAGLLTFDGNLTIAGITTLELGSASGRGTTYDAVNVSATLSYGGTLVLDLTTAGSTAFADGTTFDLFSALAVGAGDFASLSITGATSPYLGLTFSRIGSGDSAVWTSSATSEGQRLVFSQGSGDLQVVPEPATTVLLGLAAVMVVWRFRRRRA